MMKAILLLIGNIMFNATANVLMKIGIKKTDNINFANADGIIHGLIFNPALVGGVFCYVASLRFYIFTLKKLDLSTAYPISVSSAIIVVMIASSLLFKESISLYKIIGVIIIMFGIFLLIR